MPAAVLRGSSPSRKTSRWSSSSALPVRPGCCASAGTKDKHMATHTSGAALRVGMMAHALRMLCTGVTQSRSFRLSCCRVPQLLLQVATDLCVRNRPAQRITCAIAHGQVCPAGSLHWESRRRMMGKAQELERQWVTGETDEW